MRDPNRIQPLLFELLELWADVPDWRFGQLVSNIAGGNVDLFNLEDGEFVRRLRSLRAEVNKDENT